MNKLTNSNHRRASIEAWWALVARILAFILGAGILANQALVMGEFTWPMVALIAGLMGPTVSTGIST